MKDIIIGDEHARGKFKNIYEKVKDRKDIRYIISVGDYYDPYEAVTIEDKTTNFMHIVKIARQDPRVKLLLGNHDMHYLINTNEKSRMDIFNSQVISKLFFENLDLFSLVIQLDKDTIVSHAGVSPVWMESNGYTSYESINSALKALVDDSDDGKNEDSYFRTREAMHYRESLKYQRYLDYSGCGDEEHQPPTWIRPASLIQTEKNWECKTQIVGHTRTDAPEVKEYFLSPLNVENFDELKFEGDIETIKIKNSDKQIIMVDSGENLDTYLEFQS